MGIAADIYGLSTGGWAFAFYVSPADDLGDRIQKTSTMYILWMEAYGRQKELRELMGRWLRAFLKYDNRFTQKINPFTGAPISTGTNYSPSLILFIRSAETLGILSK